MSEIKETKQTKFKADDDDYLWSVGLGDYGTDGDLDDCIEFVYNAISAELEYETDLLIDINPQAFNTLYKKKIEEIRQKCLQKGFASGNDWSIYHGSLHEDE